MSTETFFLVGGLILLALALGFFIGRAMAKREDETPELKGKVEEFKAKLSAEESKSSDLKGELASLKKDLELIRAEKEKAAILISKLETEKVNAEQRIEAQKNDISEMQEKFSKDFSLLANRIFEEKTQNFSKQSKESLDQLLSPLKEKISAFEKKVEETHKERIRETSGLKAELKTLREMSSKMTEEAENLTRALKNDTKVQGNWGEMILESILESSGLRKDREYFLQKNFSTDEGRRLQPDVMIKLPDDKWVVIDSKVSLNSYEEFISEENEAKKPKHLRNHLLSLKNHIRSLYDKKYHEAASGKNLDFILMFVPIEPAYLLALHEEHSLFHEAYDKGIVMVSPTTLIASLKIISTTWKHEYQNKNALDIAERGKYLLEKFIGFTEDFEKIGDQLDRTSLIYQDAMKKLRDGRGSLVSQARKLEQLGVKTSKKISDKLLTDDSED